MKVSRPQSTLQIGPHAKASGGAEVNGKGFAAKLEKASRSSKAAAASEAKPASCASDVADIAGALKAGRVSLDAVVNQLVKRVLDKQVGPKASPAMRAKVEQALRDTLADDPLLAAKVKSLGDE